MTGSFTIEVKNADVAYKFTINRNITVLCGEGASGKTLLYELVDTYNNTDQRGITVMVTNSATIETLNRQRFSDGVLLNKTKQKRIFIIDEDSDFVNSNEFATQAITSGYYFILINRDRLDQLSCSIHEIYQLKTTQDRFVEFVPVYPNDAYGDVRLHHTVITEDKAAGRQFFSRYNKALNVIGANGRDDIINILHSYKSEPMLVVADGAAFGFNIEEVLSLVLACGGGLVVKESFEYVILKSGVVHSHDARMSTLDCPVVDSLRFSSWEQYYEDLLFSITRGTPMAYKKTHLAQVYSNAVNSFAIMTAYGLTTSTDTHFFN